MSDIVPTSILCGTDEELKKILLDENKTKYYREIALKELKKRWEQKGTMKMEHLSPFPPNCNPYHHDAFNMGYKLGENVTAMFQNHPHNHMAWLRLINTETGERVEITI